MQGLPSGDFPSAVSSKRPDLSGVSPALRTPAFVVRTGPGVNGDPSRRTRLTFSPPNSRERRGGSRTCARRRPAGSPAAGTARAIAHARRDQGRFGAGRIRFVRLPTDAIPSFVAGPNGLAPRSVPAAGQPWRTGPHPEDRSTRLHREAEAGLVEAVEPRPDRDECRLGP